MMPLTPDELQEFENLCDAEEMSLSERETVIREAFGPAAAAAYIANRGTVPTLPNSPSQPIRAMLRRSPRGSRRRPEVRARRRP